MSSGRLALQLSSLHNAFSACGLKSESFDVRGQLSGNTATLVFFILEDPDKLPKLLYLTGDISINWDTMTRILQIGTRWTDPLHLKKVFIRGRSDLVERFFLLLL